MKRLAFALLGLASCSTDTFSGGDDSGTDGQADVRADGVTGGDASCTSGSSCGSSSQCNAFDDLQASSLAPFFDISQPSGSLGYSKDQFVSCPRSLAATLAGSNVSGARAALNGFKQITVGTHARIELDMMLPKNVTGGSTFLVLYANSDASGSGVALEWNGQWVVRIRASATPPTPINPHTDVWNHVVLDVTFSATLGKVEIDYNDPNDQKQVVELQGNTLPTTGATIAQFAFNAGIVPFASISSGMTTYLDNVVFTPQ
jgi:hypothetical protein